jgi:dipeptidyl aminopeptidase/acylaminoacyl peptidase
MVAVLNTVFLKRWRACTVVLALTLSATAMAEKTVPEAVKRQAGIFSQRGALLDISLSPEGTHFASVFQSGGDQFMKVTEIQTGKTTKEIDFDYNWRFGGLVWANNERLLVQPAYKPSATNVVFQTNAIYAVNVDGKKERFLLGPASGARLGSKANRGNEGIGATILASLPEDRRKVLVQIWESGEKTASIAKLDVYTGKLSDRIYGPDAVFYCQFATNLNNEPEFCVTEDRRSDLGQIYHRDSNDTWTLVYEAQAWDEEQTIYSQLLDGGFLGTFHHPTSTKRSYFEVVVKDGQLERTLVMTDGARDLGGLTYSRQFDFGRISIRDPYPTYAYLGTNDVLNGAHKALVNAFPRSYIGFRSITADGKMALIRVSNEIKPSEYFLVDTMSLTLQRIANGNEHLLGETSVVEGFKLEARDGSPLFGFVTKANPNVAQRGAILMVHGGPHGPFDRFGYDADAQFMASLGLNVLQVNFRGSGGYGKDFERAGYKEWGRAMQDDLTDTVEWAKKNGFAANDQVCIYGGSYGGYAALAGAAFTPNLYKCAIGHVGVYDLQEMYDSGDIPRYLGGVRFLERVLGTNKADLIARSPSKHADKISIPILMTAGMDDERAPPKQTQIMEAALKQAGATAEVHYQRREGHGFFDEATERQRLERLGAFFFEHLPPKI